MTDTLKKKKNANQLRISPMRFLLTWVGGHVLGWLVPPIIVAIFLGIVSTVIGSGWIDNLPALVYGVCFSLLIGFGTTKAQIFTIRQSKGYEFKKWGQLSFIGWGIGGFLMWLTANVLISITNTTLYNVLVLSSFLLPVTIIQTSILRQYVKQSWIWLVAFIASVAVFSMSFDIYADIFFAAIGFTGYALVTGLVMLFLFLNNSKPNPQQQTAAQVDNQLAFDSTHAQLQKFLRHDSPSATTIDSIEADKYTLSEQERLASQG